MLDSDKKVVLNKGAVQPAERQEVEVPGVPSSPEAEWGGRIGAGLTLEANTSQAVDVGKHADFQPLHPQDK